MYLDLFTSTAWKFICTVWSTVSYRLHKPDTLLAFYGKMSKFNTHQKWENIDQMCTEWEVHIFNVWTMIMQYLKIKKWVTVGVTDYTNQTPSKHFWTGKCLSSTPLKIEKIFMKCTQNRRCTSSICEQSLCKVWIQRNENVWCYRLHKLGTPKVWHTDRQLGALTVGYFLGTYSVRKSSQEKVRK